MSKAPETCRYCDGHGNSKATGECGFCEKGKPLDTQEDWDNSWGRIFSDPHLIVDTKLRRKNRGR